MSDPMEPELREWIERRFRVPEQNGSKVVSLREAVASGIRPGDTVHLGITHARGSPGFWELIRQFQGTDPRLTLLAVAFSNTFAPLVHAGLARKLVTSWAGDSFPAPAPGPVYQRAWENGLEFEHWSILTFAQRLAAGARGLPWTTTRSLAGSSMEGNEGVRLLEDGAVLIPALVPDVSIVHAPAADPQGNVLFSPPLMENVWGALAARRGAIVTVDRVVDTAFVRRHAHMTRIPASAVCAVVEAPLGAHPGGLFPAGIEGIEGYGEDYEFLADLRAAGRDPAAMDTWLEEWILEPDTHERYLERLGAGRVGSLKARAGSYDDPDSLATVPSGLDDAEASAMETAIVVTARALGERIRARGYTTVLAGAGVANLAAWIAAYDLADHGTRVQLVAEMGMVGYWPRPGEPLLFNHRNFPTCTMLTDIDVALSVLVGGGAARALGALGAAQVDVHGNVNSTLIPGQRLLMGSGGANDVLTCAAESVVVVTQDRSRMVDRVPYVTGPGDRVQTLVSTLGVYRKDQGELVLTAVVGDDVDTAVRECRARCGWDLRVARAPERIEPPARDELRMVRLMDPEGWFRS